MLDQISDVFYEEARELLDNLEEQLLILENNPSDYDTISAVFRAMHTIKGSAAMFGFNAVSEFTHEVESTLDQVRNGIVPVSSELIELTLKARDHINTMLSAGQTISPEININSQSLIIAFKTYVINNGGTVSEQNIKEPKKELQPDIPSDTYRIQFKPSAKILQNGTRPELLVKELTELGTATVFPFYDSLPPLSKLNCELCYFSWDIYLTTTKSINDIHDVFIFLDSDSSVVIEKSEFSTEAIPRIGDILVSKNLISKEKIDSVMQENKPLGQILVDKELISQKQVNSALAEQQHFKNINNDAAKTNSATQQSIRVSSEKLDQLVDLIGELVTFNARLEQLSADKDIPILKNLSEQFERLILSLRNISMDIRMLAIGTLFSKFKRTVHDLASQLKKDINLIIEGAETELDKTVIEKLNDPLLHLIRNSVDHGIETPEERQSKGKDPQGTVTLSAKHQGGEVIITISDDGKGLDKDVIRRKGIEKGLINEDDVLSESEIFHLIFLPGFSTAKTVSNISGRGVGLDVVKKDITTLGGSISIESKPGEGTSFVLKIPLTLAIIDGMVTQIGQTKYIVPVGTISECLIFTPSKQKKSNNPNFEFAEVHNKDVFCINLHSFFNIKDTPPAKKELITLNTQEGSVGLIVDKILGNRQIVIKPIGKLYKNSIGIGNSTILGDGSVAIILDVFKLSSVIQNSEKGIK